jgi:hypothetical protein
MTKSRGKERTMEILAGVLIIGQFVLLAAFLVGVVSFVGLIAYDAFAAEETTATIAELPLRKTGEVGRLSA